MRILIIADIDELHWTYGKIKADLLISCGDVCDTVIAEAIEYSNCPMAFAVKGNHDYNTNFPEGVIDLHLNTVSFQGLTFGGFNGCWKYKPRGHFLYSQAEAESLLSNFPPVDIFVSHNSPSGIHEKKDDIHYGFTGFNSYINQKQPALLIHGHQHINKQTRLKETLIMGVYGFRLLEI